MPKKSNVKRADGLIAVQVYLGRVDGKRKYKTVYGKTQKEADRKAQELKQRLGIGVDVLSENTPFEVYRQQWLARKKDTVAAGSYPSYVSLANALVSLDKIPVCKLQEFHVQAVIDALAAKNPHTGRPTSKKTLGSIKKVAVQILEIARRAHVISYNNAEGVEVARSAPKSNRRSLTAEEIRRIESTPHRAQTAAMIMMFAGLRRGELSALSWGDINLRAATINVCRSVEFVGNAALLKEGAKTVAGTRVVHIPKRLVAYLREQPRGIGLVLTQRSGKMMTKSAWRALWASYMNTLNLKYGKFIKKPQGNEKAPMMIQPFGCHDLRHTFATILYLSGVDVLTARDQMGHADVQTTIGIYTHLDKEHKERKMGQLDVYLDEMQVVCKCENSESA